MDDIMPPLLILTYLALFGLVLYRARITNRSIGLYFVLSFLITPFVTYVILLLLDMNKKVR